MAERTASVATRDLLAEHWCCGSSTDGPTIRWSCGIETPSDGFPHYTAMNHAHLAAALEGAVDALVADRVAAVAGALSAAVHDAMDNTRGVHEEVRAGHVEKLLRSALAGALSVQTRVLPPEGGKP